MEVEAPQELTPRTSMTRAQRGAVVAGIALAVASVFVTFGVSLVALLGIWIAAAIGKRRGNPLTRGLGWVVGVGSVGVVTLGVFILFVVTQVPRSELTKIKQAMDSAASQPQKPPPEWLRKITPPGAQQQSSITKSLVRTEAFTIWTMVLGVTFFAAVIGAYAGTLGWLAAMLFTYGATGAWMPRGVTDPSLLRAPPLPPRS